MTQRKHEPGPPMRWTWQVCVLKGCNLIASCQKHIPAVSELISHAG